MVGEPENTNDHVVIRNLIKALVSLLGIFLGAFAIGASRLLELMGYSGWASLSYIAGWGLATISTLAVFYFSYLGILHLTKD